MIKPTTITVDLPVPGNQFGTDFFIRATLEISSFGTPETGRGYCADPSKYDPGSGPEWSCAAVELWCDCGGHGERVEIGETVAGHIREYVESKEMRDAVEEKISESESEAGDYADHCREVKADAAWRERLLARLEATEDRS